MKKILKIFIGFLLFGFLSFGLNLQAASSDTYSIYPTNISNVPNKAKLDAFLNKVLDTRKEFSSDSNYLVFLNKISEKLDSLSSSYGSNTQVKTMITYLKSGVNNIITLTKQNTDVDSFFCELFGDCESTTPICPVYSLVAPPEGCNYVYEKDANGCDVPKLSCGGVCTKEYSPVCAQPPMPPCPDGMSCTQAFPALKTYGNKCEANSAKATIQYEGECKNTTSSFNGGMLNGLIYIKSNQNGTLTNGETAFSNTKLDSVKSPFTGISCPSGYERVGIGLRIEENGAQNFQVFTCVKKQGNIDYSSMPKGTLMGLIYIPSNELGTLTNGENALSNTKLDSVRLPFTGISCPSGFERVGIGMRKEENGTQNYQVYTCVKTSGTTDYSKVSTGTMMGLIYIPSNELGTLTNGETAFSNTKLDLVKSPFTGISCPSGFERVGIGMRKEENGTKNYQVYTCVKTSVPTSSCSWQYHFVVGPVGQLDIDPNTTSCTTSLNGKSSYEISGNKQKVATCACTGGVDPVPETTNFKISGVDNGETIAITYNIDKSLGYKQCVLTAGDKEEMVSIVNGTVSVGNGSTSGLGNIGSNQSFSGTKYYKKGQFLNLYCAKVENAQWTQMEKIISPVIIDRTVSSPITTLKVSQIPGNTTSSSPSCSWQYHAVFGPVGPVDIDPNTTTCNSSLNGKSSYEISGSKQKVATCACTGGEYPQANNGKIYISNTSGNDLSKLNGTAYLDKQLYVILDGVDKSNPPKGCAKLAGTAGCNTPSGFRDYLSHEWVSNTRIVSEGANGIAPNTFPAGDYEFYSLYGTTITKIGTGKLIPSPSSCSWQYHAVFGPVGPLDINPNTTSCTTSLNGRSAYEISGSKQKVATCNCTGTDIPSTPLLTDITISKSEGKIGETIGVNYSVGNDRTCDIYVVKTKEYLKQNLSSVSNLSINYTLKQIDISSNGYINLEMKCTNGSVKTRSIKVTDSSSTPSCSGTQPSGEGVLKRLEGFGGIQNTSWTYIENNGTYTGDNFGSTMCTWTCSTGYSRSGNSCVKSSTGFTGAETVTLGNTFPTYGNSACIEQNLYNVFGGLKKSSNPKGCAQLAGTNACNNPSVFRNFTANEWVSDTTVLTQASAGSFPAGNYEFFLMYGTEIRKVGSGSLKQCNTAKVLNQSDVSTFIDNTRNELNNDAAAFVKIALEVLKYEREGYTGLRQQVASHLGITTNDVTVYINAVISKGAGELYVESYADLQAAFNSNNLGLTKNSFGINHYEKYGRSEGRYFPQK